MRSILAGLRQLIVPWGARTAPRIVIGGEDPLALEADREASIVFYVSDDQAFIHAVNVDGSDFPQYNFFTSAAGNPFTARILDVTYQLSLQTVDMIELAADGVGSLRMGGGASNVLIGSVGADVTDQVIFTCDRMRLETFAGGPPEVRLGGRQLGFEEGIVNQTPPPADTTTSASFENIDGATTLSFTKMYDDTDVELFMSVGMFATAGGTVGQFGLSISGGFGDVLIGQVLLSAANTENAASAVARVVGDSLGGLPAGTYTLTPRWRRTAGAGTLTITTSSATLSYSAREIIEQ